MAESWWEKGPHERLPEKRGQGARAEWGLEAGLWGLGPCGHASQEAQLWAELC